MAYLVDIQKTGFVTAWIQQLVFGFLHFKGNSVHIREKQLLKLLLNFFHDSLLFPEDPQTEINEDLKKLKG